VTNAQPSTATVRWWHYSHQLINGLKDLSINWCTISFKHLNELRPFKINKVTAVHEVTSHFLDLRWIYRCSRTLVFDPTKLYILIPTKQTLTPGLDTYPNPNQNSALIFLLPLKSSRKLWFKKCQSSIWRFRQTLGKVNNFAGLRSGDPGSVLISDLPWTFSDSNLRSGVQLTQHANWSDQRQTYPNNLILYVTTFVLNFAELITHPALVNIKSFSIAEHISIALPKELYSKLIQNRSA